MDPPRGKWNQSCYEARVPRVPIHVAFELLLPELCRYALRYRPFRFRFGKSPIYKGMLQFLCSQYRMDYIVQPCLPVDRMALRHDR